MSNIAWMVHTDTTTGFITGVHSIPGDVTVRSVAEFMRTYHRDSSGWFFRGIPVNDYYNWYSDSWVVDSIRVNREVRLQRDYKLGMSDWTQANDSPLSDEKKADWATYRQTLRDIMANLPADLDDPANITWPTEPS